MRYRVASGWYCERWDRVGTKLVFRRRVFRHHRCQSFRRQLWPQREKIMPARHAAQRRQAQQPSATGGHSGNSFARHSLELQVSANSTARIKKIPQGNGSRMEARFTLETPPRNDTHSTEKIIRYGAPPRPAAARSLARWAVHRKTLAKTSLPENRR